MERMERRREVAESGVEREKEEGGKGREREDGKEGDEEGRGNRKGRLTAGSSNTNRAKVQQVLGWSRGNPRGAVDPRSFPEWSVARLVISPGSTSTAGPRTDWRGRKTGVGWVK